MLNNENSCSLYIEYVDGDAHHYICFKDGQGVRQTIKVSYQVYLEFVHSNKIVHNQQRSDKCHINSVDLMAESLDIKAYKSSAEDVAMTSLRDKQLHLAIQSLPEIQRRRFILYHEYGLTYE